MSTIICNSVSQNSPRWLQKTAVEPLCMNASADAQAECPERWMEHEQGNKKKQLQVKRLGLKTQAVNIWDCYCSLLLVFTDVLPPRLHQTLKFEHYSIEQQHILLIHLTVNSFCLQQFRYTHPTPPHPIPQPISTSVRWRLISATVHRPEVSH